MESFKWLLNLTIVTATESLILNVVTQSLCNYASQTNKFNNNSIQVSPNWLEGLAWNIVSYIISDRGILKHNYSLQHNFGKY